NFSAKYAALWLMFNRKNQRQRGFSQEESGWKTATSTASGSMVLIVLIRATAIICTSTVGARTSSPVCGCQRTSTAQSQVPNEALRHVTMCTSTLRRGV